MNDTLTEMLHAWNTNKEPDVRQLRARIAELEAAIIKEKFAMTADEYLQLIISKNPAIGKPDEEVIKLKARGIRALIRQAHEKGFERGREFEQHYSGLKKNHSGFEKMVHEMFGGKK